MKRLFIAVKIPASKELLNISNSVSGKLSSEKIKWVQHQNHHITLKFLGDTEDFFINSLCIILKKIAQNYHPFLLKLEQVGIFGKQKKPRVIWIGISENEEIRKLKEDIDEHLTELGFEKDPGFSPHLTLGRIKNINDFGLLAEVIEKYKTVVAGNVEIDKFILYESVLKKTGPEYIEIEEFNLNH